MYDLLISRTRFLHRECQLKNVKSHSLLKVWSISLQKNFYKLSFVFIEFTASTQKCRCFLLFPVDFIVRKRHYCQTINSITSTKYKAFLLHEKFVVFLSFSELFLKWSCKRNGSIENEHQRPDRNTVRTFLFSVSLMR